MNHQNVEIFLSYSHQDVQLAQELRTHLRPLEEKNPFVYIWSTDNIHPGTEWHRAINQHLTTAQIIILLVSSDFLASKEFSLIEAKQKTETVLVLPIILRPTAWDRTFLGSLKPLPANGKPLSTWKSRDLAYLEIIDNIESTIQTLKSPVRGDSEKKQLQAVLKTFSEQELLTLGFDLRLNIKDLLEDTSEKSAGGYPKVSIDRLLQYMEQQGRIKDLADYIRKNRPALDGNRENIA